MSATHAENKRVAARNLVTEIVEYDVSWPEEGCLLHCQIRGLVMPSILIFLNPLLSTRNQLRSPVDVCMGYA